MDYFILFCIIGFSAIAILMYRLIRSINQRHETEGLMAQVRNRAEKRQIERAFADTESLNDPWNTSLDLSNAIRATEIDGRMDGYGDLTDEQKETINLIFDGYGMPIKKDESRHSGPTAMSAAGVPWAHSVFSKDNVVEIEWPDHLTN